MCVFVCVPEKLFFPGRSVPVEATFVSRLAHPESMRSDGRAAGAGLSSAACRPFVFDRDVCFHCGLPCLDSVNWIWLLFCCSFDFGCSPFFPLSIYSLSPRNFASAPLPPLFFLFPLPPPLIETHRLTHAGLYFLASQSQPFFPPWLNPPV